MLHRDRRARGPRAVHASFSLSLSLSLSCSLSRSLTPPPPLSGPRTFHKEEVAHHGPEALGLHYLRDLVELLVLAEGRVELPLLVRVRARVRVRVPLLVRAKAGVILVRVKARVRVPLLVRAKAGVGHKGMAEIRWRSELRLPHLRLGPLVHGRRRRGTERGERGGRVAAACREAVVRDLLREAWVRARLARRSTAR